MNQEESKVQNSSKAPTYDQIRNKWNKMSPHYITMDAAPQTFFYTLANMLELKTAKNVLQIACGAGKLIPYVLDLKAPQTFYYATDISDEMIKFAKIRLQEHLKKYESKLTLEEWIKKQNLQFDVVNGQEKIPKDIKFDRIICNLVLMLTTDPVKMLKNLYDHAEDGCLLGLAVWGNRQENHFFKFMQELSKENNLIPANTRSNFFLYSQIQQLVEECGWEKILAWQQKGMFPIIQHSQTYIHPFLKQQALKKLPQNLHLQFHQKINELVNDKKCGLQFSSKLMIVRKRKNS